MGHYFGAKSGMSLSCIARISRTIQGKCGNRVPNIILFFLMGSVIMSMMLAVGWSPICPICIDFGQARLNSCFICICYGVKIPLDDSVGLLVLLKDSKVNCTFISIFFTSLLEALKSRGGKVLKT